MLTIYEVEYSYTKVPFQYQQTQAKSTTYTATMLVGFNEMVIPSLVNSYVHNELNVYDDLKILNITNKGLCRVVNLVR